MTTISNTAPRQRLTLLLNDEILEPAFVALTLIGIVTGLILEGSGAPESIILVVHLATYFFGGFYAVRAIIEALRHWSIEVDLLMVLAALGAGYLGDFTEGAILLFLFSLSNVLQAYAMRRTEQAITALMQLRPDTVTVHRDGRELDLPIEAVQVGDVIVLRPGDRVPLDGVIERGSGSFDESALTGESMPVQKGPGMAVLAGTLNQTGALEVRVTKPASESTLARIITMVSEAQARKARSQSFLEYFEQRYAIGVIVAVILFILAVPALTGADFADTFYRGMVLLTVASPCALVISVPASLLSAIAAGARRGVLFKGGVHLEELSKVRVIAFDKTGTLTFGKPTMTDLVPMNGVDEADLLAIVARAEQPSEHPIARAILQAAEERGITVAPPEQFTAVTGMGVRAMWEGVETLVGSPRLFAEAGVVMPSELSARADELMAQGRGSVLFVRRGEQWLGLVAVMDRERPDAAQRIAELRAAGIERIVMLTGDNPQVAEAMARRLGVDEVHAGLLPADKLRIVEQLRQRYGGVAMVGDGVNDAPALAAATVGIAMGAAGTDAALETADLVLMRDDLSAITYALRLSRRTQRVVWQNIIFALAVVVVLVTTTLTVGVPLPLGVVGHEGSTIIVVLNGLRLLMFR
ncbi:heavy metal translocating P-type ATPase [Chloroflexus aggregans]|uniref:Heavy metal translocating P-type ATPase n=1 Tax=Chloroflexus aggregans (strain MD-66 / DSM 9485) TaxID=326427 RepID=B8G5V2_CHLAD|nr:heavy metal translocating P-type ATPase [Chloroflexus aggregans]ACL23813.1 heavy metal translocating P-type ATPase [Chloroflexus aggregans DSM 9485]